MVPNGLVFFICIAITVNFVSSIEHDFRYISYQDLQGSLNKFYSNGVNNFSEILFDVSRSQLLVGARDSIHRLSLLKLQVLESAIWKATKNDSFACISKGQTEENCHNYIKVLVTNGREIFACGTHAFVPRCSLRDIENISQVTEYISGIAKCPGNPAANGTSLISENGVYYYGGPTDFLGSISLISKSVGNLTTLHTNQYNSFWLNEPQFVGTFENDKFVYFIFRESAVEYINCGKAVYSRIARICKNDVGGKMMFKDHWTTFIKARLNCSTSGDYPFYFNEIQSFFYVTDQNTFYATFTTSPSGIAGSAVCAFNLTGINAAFDGPFKYQEHAYSAWQKHANVHQDHFECKSSHHENPQKYQLMDSAVQPTTFGPLHVAELERFTYITVDVVATKLYSALNVIYVATLEGFIKKITLLPRTQATCLVEVWQTVRDTRTPIKNMRFLKETSSVYITTDEELMQIPAAHCRRHTSKHSCLNAMDPYCGWNEREETCTTPPNGDTTDKNWIQNASVCPILDAPVDGGWSSWSFWSPCIHRISSFDSANDNCLCQTRQCNNPTPTNHGLGCEGPSVAVANCTVHGGWSDWSAWSACTSTCGAAVKTKFRTCSNPAPAFGGRVCVGQDRFEAICIEIPPCPIKPQHGSWGPWSPWTECSGCLGFKSRNRKCDRPAPSYGGNSCEGNDMEYLECSSSCVEQRKSLLTEWIGNEKQKKIRYKVLCKAPVKHQHLIKLVVKEDVCHNNDCYTEDVDYETWSSWSSWSECSALCGGGEQNRSRTCKARRCQGMSQQTQTKDCNKHSCNEIERRSNWNCWSEWSPCNVSCGWGIKTRLRTCLTSQCVGDEREEMPCENRPCGSILGWGNWTTWSLCDENLEQHRKRKCWKQNPGPQMCQGPKIETRMCVSGENTEITKLATFSSSCLTSAITFFVVTMVSLFLMVAFQLWLCHRKKKTTIPSSPHYISAEQNPYISVPTRDKPKRLNSTGASSIHPLNGTMKSLKRLDEYEITTLKRNSNELKYNGLNKHHVADNSYYD